MRTKMHVLEKAHRKNTDFGENQMQKDITLGKKCLQKYVHIREGNVYIGSHVPENAYKFCASLKDKFANGCRKEMKLI